MYIKESKELQLLATVSGKTTKQISEQVVTELIKRKIIEDINDNWGFTVAECYNRDVTVLEVAAVLDAIGVPNKSKNFDAMLKLVLIGSGDCPKCGGKMDVCGGDYKQTGGFDYDSEPEYMALWEAKKCLHCGHNVINE